VIGLSYGNRIVAICDILGFKSIIDRKSLNELEDLYTQLMIDVAPDACESERHTFKKGVGHKADKFVVNHAIFSDTIVLWLDIVETTDKLDLKCFLSSLCILIGLSFHFELPLRAGIAFGQCYMEPSKSIFIGKVIVDAYLTEQSQNWVGGSFHSSCFNLPENLSFPTLYGIDNWGTLIEYNVPFKKKIGIKRIKRPIYAINWGADITEQGYNWLNAQCRNKSLKRKDRNKYRNAMRFYHCLPEKEG
jgi:hypothetical protein